MGDKCVETANVKYTPLRFASPEVVREKKSRAPVCEKQAAAGGMDAEHATVYMTAGNAGVAASSSESRSPGARAVVAIMSDDVGVIEKLSKSYVATQFDTVLLPERAKTVPAALGMTGGKDMHQLDSGFNANRFEDVSFRSLFRLSWTRH